MALSIETRFDVLIRIKEIDDHHLCVGFLYYLVICIPSLLLIDIHTTFMLGAVFGPANSQSPNTSRELFGVPDIALYALAPKHVFVL